MTGLRQSSPRLGLLSISPSYEIELGPLITAGYTYCSIRIFSVQSDHA